MSQNFRSRIKILFLIDSLMPGGTESQLVLLADSLDRRLFAPTIGVLKENRLLIGSVERTPVVEFDWSGVRYWKNLLLLQKLFRYLQKERFSIIQTQFADAEIYGSIAAKLCLWRPVLISTRRNLYHWVGKEPLQFALTKRMTRLADRILVNSYKAAAECQARETISKNKICIIQNGVDITKFNGIPRLDAKKALGFAGDQYPLIGVVANWRPVKGLESFLRAAALVYQEQRGARFVLAGSGPQETELRAIAEGLGIEERVKFIRNPGNIPQIMASFDVAVQPSLTESFSNVLLEYMASGKAIVATKVGDAEKVIEDGKEGILVPPDNPDALLDAIVSLCNTPERAEQMGNCAREKVCSQWSLDRMVRRYEELYLDLVR